MNSGCLNPELTLCSIFANILYRLTIQNTKQKLETEFSSQQQKISSSCANE
jgi:hypothetical protein